MDADALALEAIPKAVHYLGVALAIGIAVARPLLAPLHQSPDVSLRLTVAAAILVVSASLARLAGHTVVAFGVEDGMTVESLRVMAIESRWGASWRWQFAAAGALLAAAAFRLRGRPGWIVWTAAAIACAIATPLLGHAAGSAPRILLHAGHLIALSAWLGTLLVILLLDGGRSTTDQLTAVVARFSPLALTAAAVVLGTGVVAVFAYVPTWNDLIWSTYGQVLLLKLLLVAGIAACGFGNWRRARQGAAPWRPLLRAEGLLALLVLVVSSVLTETEHP